MPLSRPTRLRFTAFIAITLLAGLTLTGCGDDDRTDQIAAPATTATRTANPSPTPTAAPSPAKSASTAAPDESLANTLARAGIEDADVRGLGAAAQQYGYGLGRSAPLQLTDARALAVLMVDTCREVRSGFQSWSEVVDSDVASGAPRADAEGFASFVRTQFCPQVTEAQQRAPKTRTPAPQQDPEPSSPGVLATTDELTSLYRTVPYGPCAAAAGEPIGEPLALRMNASTLLCAEISSVWDGRVPSVDVVFETSVSRRKALRVAEQLMPPDSRPLDTREGRNPPYAPNAGGCLSASYSSDTIASLLATTSDSFEGPGVNATLYSDRQTIDGSSASFDGTVRVMSVGIGGHNMSQGSVYC
jgi:hypothetical protein